MTIYYLMVKTHKITGLKYLCQTIKNPNTYKGFGIDWKLHLKKYGNHHTTNIIKECNTRKELTYWGKHYSKLWNVALSEEWANRIPETGGGTTGEDHYLYDHTTYSFENIKNKNVVVMTQNQFCDTYKLNKGNVCLLIQGLRKKVGDWKLVGTDYQPPKIYMFEHTNTGEMVKDTVVNFCNKFDLTRTNIYAMIRKKSSKIGSVKGWRVVWPAQTV